MNLLLSYLVYSAEAYNGYDNPGVGFEIPPWGDWTRARNDNKVRVHSDHRNCWNPYASYWKPAAWDDTIGRHSIYDDYCFGGAIGSERAIHFDAWASHHYPDLAPSHISGWTGVSHEHFKTMLQPLLDQCIEMCWLEGGCKHAVAFLRMHHDGDSTNMVQGYEDLLNSLSANRDDKMIFYCDRFTAGKTMWAVGSNDSDNWVSYAASYNNDYTPVDESWKGSRDGDNYVSLEYTKEEPCGQFVNYDYCPYSESLEVKLGDIARPEGSQPPSFDPNEVVMADLRYGYMSAMGYDKIDYYLSERSLTVTEGKERCKSEYRCMSVAFDFQDEYNVFGEKVYDVRYFEYQDPVCDTYNSWYHDYNHQLSILDNGVGWGFGMYSLKMAACRSCSDL